jgi:clan AA aspartic protease
VITGRVFRRRPTVLLSVFGPNGQIDDLEVIVDTGFTGYLALPPSDVAALGLPLSNYYDAGLADGSRVRVAVHEATITWHGGSQAVLVMATGKRALLGMSLIYGSRLTLDGEDGGALTLEELP